MNDETSLRFFLIDYENVKRAGLSGLESCDEYDKIIIFYSDACDTITFDIHKQLMDTKSIVEYQYVKVGEKDSLDHQLSSYLGYLISENKLGEFYIVSRDRGFEFITDFWQNKNIIISQILDLNFTKIIVESPVLLAPLNIQSLSSYNISEEAINDALMDFPQHKVIMTQIITQTDRKTEVNRGVNIHIPPDERSAISKAIRPLIKNYIN